MKNFFKNQKGINLISLSIAVIILLVLTNVVLYNVKSNLGVEKLKGMQSDIETLRDKISYFYSQNGTIPANINIEYTNISNIQNAGVISTAVDTGKFYVIDLSALENLTLNYGEDYKKIKSGEATTKEQINALQDLYIINENSHNIFFVRGIKFDNEWFYTDYTSDDIDTKAVNLITIDTTKESWSPVYDKTTSYKDEYGDIATIPKGFQVSRKSGEDIIATGLVVKAEDESEFVWVPVDKDTLCADGITGKEIAELVDDNYRGVLYEYGEMTSYKIEYFEYGIKEPDYLTNETYADNSSYNIDENGNKIVTEEGMQTEYNKMVESIQKYGGFYVGRYETSINNDTVASIVATPMDASLDNQMWYGMYRKQKEYASLNEKLNEVVGSSMIWGSQYDAIMNWMLNSEKEKYKVTVDSEHHELTQTGATIDDVMNNIYDLQNNLWELTLESDGTMINRIGRGRDHFGVCSPHYRFQYTPIGTYNGYGSRMTLYIK